MRYPASETAEKHERILNEASRLFRERGFTRVSVGEVMQATGLTHGPFYNHFASKEALMADSLECCSRGMLEEMEATPGSAEGKAGYIERYLSPAHRDAPGKGCMMAAVGSDVRMEPRVRGPFTKLVKASVEKLASHFPWRSRKSARGDSIRALASMVGALMLARAVDDEQFSEEILREVRQGLL